MTIKQKRQKVSERVAVHVTDATSTATSIATNNLSGDHITDAISKDSDPSTEQRIKAAARMVFMAKGFDGARMQEIADAAGINKALVHYYFRSKELLFRSIFQELARDLYASMGRALRARLSIDQKIRMIVEDEMDQLAQNPELPLFIMREITRDADGFRSMVAHSPMKDLFELFAKEVRAAVRRREIIAIDPMQLFINLQALIRFPFIARPLVQAVSGMSDVEYGELLEKRKKDAADFIIRSICPPIR